MGYTVHARSREKGLVFRIWSTFTESYITEDLSEPDLRESLLTLAIRDTISSFNLTVDDRLARAKEHGTSATHEEPVALGGKWERQRH